jgi:hypothetical protein
MDTTTFLLHAAAAGLIGAPIGLERLWPLLHTAGLRMEKLMALVNDETSGSAVSWERSPPA